MSAIWLQPLAWWGLLAVVAPILIHLLARQRSRPVPFPSLRFLQVTRLAALRRRMLSDLSLLVVRLLVLATAVGALAAPVFVTGARERTWQTRMARAIVEVKPADATAATLDGQVAVLVAEERATAFVSWTGAVTGRAADVLASAVEWLTRQPPAARELVIVGDLRAGLLTAADIAAVPREIGIRILPFAGEEPTRDVAISITAQAGEGPTLAETVRVTLDDAFTHVARAGPSRTAPRLSVVAAPAEQPLADALRDAVLAEGLMLLQDRERHLVIELRGAATPPLTEAPPSESWMRRVLETTPGARGRMRGAALVVQVDVAASDPRAVLEVARLARAAFAEPLGDREPRRIPSSMLAAWSRPPRPVPDSAEPVNEGDGRWLWLGVLILLGVEHLLRGRAVRRGGDATASHAEARVA